MGKKYLHEKRKSWVAYVLGMGLLFLLLQAWPSNLWAQQADRLTRYEQRLHELAVLSPGLAEKVTLSVAGASLQEFLRALAETSNTNINVDPNLQLRVYNNFQGETPINILLFIAKEYNLDLGFTGSIISVTALDPSKVRQPARPVQATYDAANKLISLSLENDSLVVVARTITQLTGTNVIVTNDLQGKQVSLFVQGMELGAALRQLAFSNQVKLAETAGGSFVYLPLGPNEENFINGQSELSTRRLPIQQTPSDGNPQFFLDATDNGSGAKLLSIEAQNTPIDQIIKNAAAQVEANYFLFSGLQGNATAKLTNVGFDQLLTSLLRGTVYTFKNDNGIYLIGERRLEGLREIKAVHLQHRSIDTVQAMIPAEWKQGVEIKEFREQNTLLLAGSAPQVNEIASLVKQLDVLVPMILIEVNMLDVRKGHTISTGITMGVSDSVRTGGELLSSNGTDFTFGARSINDFLSRIGTGSFNLGRVSPNFYVRLRALENNNNVEMRSVPKLSTLNGHAATLSIGSSRYYSISTQSQLGTLTPQNIITQQFNEIKAATTIKIKPIVSGDEQVTLNITVDISDFTQDTPINQPPPTSTSKFESIIRIRNEETVVLGGIERYENAETGGGVPLLSRIPVLKWIFSNKTKSKNKVVSVVFIKPTIIYQ